MEMQEIKMKEIQEEVEGIDVLLRQDGVKASMEDIWLRTSVSTSSRR